MDGTLLREEEAWDMPKIPTVMSCIVKAAVAGKIQPRWLEVQMVQVDAEAVVAKMRTMQLRQRARLVSQKGVKIDAAARPVHEPGCRSGVEHAVVVVPVQPVAVSAVSSRSFREDAVGADETNLRFGAELRSSVDLPG